MQGRLIWIAHVRNVVPHQSSVAAEEMETLLWSTLWASGPLHLWNGGMEKKMETCVRGAGFRVLQLWCAAGLRAYTGI